ncbi:MAG: glycosyltransferase family 4 protein [Acidimicrobiales bacterium]
MRIVLSHPTSWPTVRRGMERLLADLERYLGENGHDVSAVSASARSMPLALPTSLRRHLPDRAITYQARIALTLRHERPDLVHGLHYLDGIGSRLGSPVPYVLHLPGIPTRAALAGRRLRKRLFAASLEHAGAVIAMSHAAADALADAFDAKAVVVPNGVFTEEMAANARPVRRSCTPSVLFPGDATDPRKRIGLLADALELVRTRWPGIRLVVAWPIDEPSRRELERRSRVDVEVREVPDPAAMASLYAEAWVTCLPSVGEAFGLVFVESLACGTPAVGVRDGGVPEVLGEPAWLADPDDPADLARTLNRALRDSCSPLTASHCRELAQPFDWSIVGPRFVSLYEEVLACKQPPARQGQWR